ncbi:MAG: hypothetical protein KGL54_10780 [Sphingomonadales bacterium]|nr:hypothetical protein [Sphingomonadales bacterium]
MTAQQASPTLYPARYFMRPIWVDLGAKAFTLGGAPVTFPLRQLGYLDMLVVHLTGTYTVANANLVFNQLQPYNIVPNFMVQTPGSPLPPINLGGKSLHVWNLRNNDFAPIWQGFRFPAQGTLDANAYHATQVDQFPVAIGAQTFHLWWVLPFHLSPEDIRGTLPLGNSTVTNLVVSAAAAADVVTVAANLTLPVFTIDVAQVYLTPPPAGAPIIGGGVDTGWAVAYDETYQAVPAVGLQKVTVVPNYTILGIMHDVVLNNADDSVDVTNMTLRVNSSYFTDPTGLPTPFNDFRQAMEQGVPLPVGVFMYDFDVIGAAGWVHTDQVTEIESDITIAAGATLGVNPRIYTSVRRLVDLNPAGAGIGAG